MSETPQGPGYWQASDGRWYPPETRAASAAPAQSEPTPQWPDPLASGDSLPARPKRRARTMIMVATVVVMVLAGAGAYAATRPSPKAPAVESPGQVLRGALFAAYLKGSVTVVVTVTRAGGTKSTESQQSTSDTGSQMFVSGSSVYQDRCVPGTCYVEGNVGGLEIGFDMTPARAEAAGGKWLALPATSATSALRRQYEAVLADTTLNSYLSGLTFPAGLTNLGTATVDGQRVVRIGGHEAVTELGTQARVVILVAAGNPHTLVSVTFSATSHGGTETETVVYSRWGSTPPTEAPPTSVSFAKYLPTSG